MGQSRYRARDYDIQQFRFRICVFQNRPHRIYVGGTARLLDGGTLDAVYIENLAFNPDYYNGEESFMRPGGSAHASFDEIKVTKITVRISQKLDPLKAAVDALKVSEIVVLGR